MKSDSILTLVQAANFKRLVPAGIKNFLLGYVRQDRYIRNEWVDLAPFPGIEEVSTYTPKVDVRLGIIKSYNLWHQYYMAACRELGVPYCTIDIERPDWIEKVGASHCDAFLVWPTAALSVWKQLYDERLAVISEFLGKVIYPDLNAMWLYESKRRMHYWLVSSGFPHPRTWIFYDREEAMAFAEKAEIPLVTKTDLGAESRGVRIIRSRRQIRNVVRTAFGRGIIRRGEDRRDRQWSNVLFQAYIARAIEWRIIRIGRSYFGYEKLRVGDFHSGTAQWRYVRPPDDLLNLARDVTDKGQFTSMSLDILVDESGNPYITELQGVFGMLNKYACMVNGRIGRMLDNGDSTWRFEEGDYCGNRMCNLRVEVLLDALGVRVPTV